MGCSFDKYMADNRNGSKSAGIKGRDHLTATKRITAYKHNLTGIQRWNGVFLFIFSQLTMLQDKRFPSSGSRPDEMILRPFVLTETRCESSRAKETARMTQSVGVTELSPLFKERSVVASAPWGPTRFL